MSVRACSAPAEQRTILAALTFEVRRGKGLQNTVAEAIMLAMLHHALLCNCSSTSRKQACLQS